MLKRIKQIGFLMLTLTLTVSCSDWLDVNPSHENREEKQFSSEYGFGSALAGVYEIMAEGQLYGTNLSFGFIEHIANATEAGGGGAYISDAKSHQYNTQYTEPIINDIWSRAYTAIAHANKIIEWSDKKKEVFEGNNYSIVKGEAIALRAFLHFDLLRLFGPEPNAPGAGSTRSIPYKTVLSTEINTLETFDAVIEKIINDLLKAEELMKEDNVNWSVQSSSEIMKYRVNHLNKWAVKATLARAYQWKGDKVNAVKYAKDVISNSGRSLSGHKMYESLLLEGEQLFTIEVKNLAKIINTEYYADNDLSASSQHFGDGTFNDLYYNWGEQLDSRAASWTEIITVEIPGIGSGPAYAVVKYKEKYKKDNNFVPIIRLSEMYLIVAECDPVDGVDFYRRFAENRNSIASFPEYNENEYHREFLGEGQLFYKYKRDSRPYSYIYSDMTGNYVLPLPKLEQEFND